jgi:hypothetical protein
MPDDPDRTGLPAGLAPPVKVALARSVTKMHALPGTLLYEPKWDGNIHCTLSISGPAGLLLKQSTAGASNSSGFRVHLSQN